MPQSVTITATSVTDATRSASIVALLGGQFHDIRVNAGGPSHYDPNGKLWNGDVGYDTGSSYSAGNTITNTTTPYLYQSEHFATGTFSYRFYVPPGTFTVSLKFAEIFFTQSGQRAFNVSINGTQVLTNFDIVAQALVPNRAIDRNFPVNLPAGGAIVIQFTPVVSNPKISAIEITAP